MLNRVHTADVLDFAAQLPPQSVQCIVTSPPYWRLRSYLAADHPDKAREIGQEQTVAAYVAGMVGVFGALRPALKDDGTCWINLGDSFLPDKNLALVPHRFALAMQDAGWILRSTIVWDKPNAMPESTTDRPTQAHEYIFLFAKQRTYFYDHEAIKEPISQASIDRISQPNFGNQTGGPKDYGTTGVNASRSIRKTLENFAAKQDGHGRRHDGFNERYDFDNPPAGRNKRTVWRIPTVPYASAHFATFNPDLIRPCILAGTSAHGECAACGKAWVRVVEEARDTRTPYATRGTGSKAEASGARNDAGPKAIAKVLREDGKGGDLATKRRTTTGWQPQCSCNAPTVAQVVLDPFGGSGTVAQVAVQERRQWVTCDLDARSVGWTAARLAGAQTRLGIEVA